MTTIAGEPVPRHGIRIFVIWLVLTAIAVPLIVLVLGPHLPPPHMSTQSLDQRNANIVMTALLVPIALFVLVYFIYSFVFFRQTTGAIVDGPPIKGHEGAQLLWIVLTSTIVLALAVWGSYTLTAGAHGAGGGQGPDPAAKPAGYQHALPVQVIAQQWEWTFRYPTYGGIETRDLAIPDHTLVAFHVTSLDVTHSFWAYELGVKADAVAGVDNIAYVNPRHTGVLPDPLRRALRSLARPHVEEGPRLSQPRTFQTWIAAAQKKNASIVKYLPKYSSRLFPGAAQASGLGEEVTA